MYDGMSDDIAIMDRYADTCKGGFFHGAWSRLRAKLVETDCAATNRPSTPCPHLWVGTDGVHCVVLNQCIHPDVNEWARHA